MTRFVLILALCFLVACGQNSAPSERPTEPVSRDDVVRPKLRPAGLGRVVPKDASTAEQFDVTTDAERRDAAQAPSGAQERLLGHTIASLGDPTQAGFWIKTSLATAQRTGRVVFPGNGRSAKLELLPIAGSDSSGSRMSLAAFRLLGAPLTGLPEIEVYEVSTGGS